MMTVNNTELNALIGSRICHDLISPVGAIGNGVELLGMTNTRTPVRVFDFFALRLGWLKASK